MDIRIALLAVITTVPLTACSSTWNCHPDDEMFAIDEPVTAAEIDELIAAGYVGQTTWDEVECETVCSTTYQKIRGWSTSEIDSCSLTLPENPDGSGMPGHVTCAGTGIEYFCEGRRPLGLSPASGLKSASSQTASLGHTLAAMAYLEAASVLAFEQLAAQLAGWGAPRELIERCEAAADDERDHARWLTALAEQHGAVVPAPTLVDGGHSLFEVACHNAVEGCVHDTFAALIAATRARRATSLVLRRTFSRIASDETRHGQLAWDLHAWMLGQLEGDEARAVEARQTHALAELPARARALCALPIELGPLAPGDAHELAAALGERLAA